MTNKKANDATAIASMNIDKIAVNRDNGKKSGLKDRRDLISAVYKVAKDDHILKARIYVFYVNEIVKKGATLETTMPFFKQEIAEMFDRGDLEIMSIDGSDDCIDADSVYNNLRRLFNQARSRYEKIKAPKGTDQRDNEIRARSFFDNTKLADIVEGFTLIKHDRKQKIIRALFIQLDPDVRLQLLLDLETIKDQPIPEIDDIK